MGSWPVLQDSPIHNPPSLSAQLRKSISGPGDFIDIDQGEPLGSEIETALRSLNDHRAGGCDYIPSELFKQGGEKIVLLLKVAIPDEWRTSKLLPFHKKGDQGMCSNNKR